MWQEKDSLGSLPEVIHFHF